MIKSKLFVLGVERELLSTHVEYYRYLSPSGHPNSILMGGQLTVSFISCSDDDRLLNWMTYNPKEDICILTEGKIAFYDGDWAGGVLFEYKFNDAALISWKESFSAIGNEPMTVTITISGAIQEIKGITYVKTWQKSWVPPSEQASYQPKEGTSDGLIIEYAHFEDEEGNRINEKYMGKAYLVVGTSNQRGEYLDISLTDPEHDFKYQGNLVKDDQLKNIKITGDVTRIPLEIIEEAHKKQ